MCWNSSNILQQQKNKSTTEESFVNRCGINSFCVARIFFSTLDQVAFSLFLYLSLCFFFLYVQTTWLGLCKKSEWISFLTINIALQFLQHFQAQRASIYFCTLLFTYVYFNLCKFNEFFPQKVNLFLAKYTTFKSR